MQPASSRLHTASKLLCTRISSSMPYVAVGRRPMSAFSQMSDNDPDVLEKAKHKQMSKKDKDWHEKLATHSEAAVKADKDSEKSTEQLQRESVEGLKDSHNE